MLNIKKVKLTANYVLTTKETYNGEAYGGVIIPAGTLKEYQKVVEIGPMVKAVKVGELVSINPKRYAVTKYRDNDIKGDIEHMQRVVSYNIPEIEINHEKHLLITDQDIEFVIEEYEEEKPGKVVVPEKKIVMP